MKTLWKPVFIILRSLSLFVVLGYTVQKIQTVLLTAGEFPIIHWFKCMMMWYDDVILNDNVILNQSPIILLHYGKTKINSTSKDTTSMDSACRTHFFFVITPQWTLSIDRLRCFLLLFLLFSNGLTKWWFFL